MRWLLVSSQHHPSQGGIGAYVSRFVEAAVQAKWNVNLVTRPGPLHPTGAIVHEIQTADMNDDFARRLPALRRMERVRPYRYALWSRAVAEHLSNIDDQFDAIEFVDCQAEGFASLCSAAVRGRFCGTPMIIHAHTPMFVEERLNQTDLSRFGRSVYHEWERRALRAADGVITTSHLLTDRLPDLRNSAVIPYPIAGDRNIPDRISQQGEELILLVGSVQPRKGVESWALSLNRVLRQRPKATAILIGPDTPTAPDGLSMIAHLQRLIDPCVLDRFRWTGALEHDEVLRMIEAAALVVVPSLFESFSFVAAEALMAGTPVVVSDQVGIAEHVDGLPTFPAGNIEALAEIQLELLGDRAAALQRAKANWQSLALRCSPWSHLQRRAAFIDAVKCNSSFNQELENGEDAIVELDSFMAEVETAESSAELVSSAVS